jgi:lipoyl(octanoyl) transferase
VQRKHPTSNIERPTSNLARAEIPELDVRSSMFDVRCSLLHLQSGPGSAAFNMALDEALLEAMPRLQQSALRFYGWTEPAASFGYFQKYSDVECLTALRPLVRRPTGGGLVPHDADWTYSLVFPAGTEWHSLRAGDSYRRVHAWLQAAFALLDVKTELAPDCRRAGPGQCFAGHEKFDLLWNGKKIAGAAQRRTRAGLLIQGSVQPPLGHADRGNWERAMCEAVPSEGRVKWLEFKPDVRLRERAEELAREKYSPADYNRKR